MHSQLPHFIVIGAMKCATTTLHHDLDQHPGIYCGRKELNALTLAGNFETDSHQVYANNFKGAGEGDLRGEVSTTYTQLPDWPGVVEKASELIGPELKIIYIVRNPVERTLRHHQHMMNWHGEGKMGPDINVEIGKHQSLIDYSCYAKQLTPWLAKFGREHVLVVRFEDFIGDRQATLNAIFDFLGVEHFEIKVHEGGLNRGHDRRVAGKHVLRLYESKLFQRILKPLSPSFLRSALRLVLLRKSQVNEAMPTAETIDQIIDGVEKDLLRFYEMIGEASPMWDLDATRKKIVNSRV